MPNSIPSTGETEVGSVEVQPTRDNQPGVTDYRWGGSFRIPTQPLKVVIQSSPMPKKTLPCRRQGTLLTVTGKCPIHAELVHLTYFIEHTEYVLPSNLFSFPALLYHSFA